jgi:serine/threonine protein kinase
MLARLKLEARAGKMLRHSSIVHTFGIRGTDDVFGEAFYLVMEYVEGINVEELINLKGPVRWQQAADFIRQAAAGLHHAHGHGMVHRDVKPGNLLVDAQGMVKILDFGLALIDSAEDEEFSLAMIFGHSCLGTADYIAPEQTFDSFAVDARADIYSLGCTLYVALTGKLPYPITSSNEKLEGHRSRTAPPVRSLASDVPAELAAVVERMMAKRPEDRYQTMAEVVEALSPFAQRMPVEFDFPKILAWRAKEARRRFALHRRGPGGRSSSSSSAALHGLNSGLSSMSTKRLPQASADTAVEQRSRNGDPLLSLAGALAGTESTVPPSKEAEAPPAPPTGPALIALEGDSHHPLKGNRIVIGRDSDCDVQILSSQVSGRHCELRFDGARWKAIDLGSKNGIQVNGAPVKEQVLKPGDRLGITKSQVFRVEYTIPPLVDDRLVQLTLMAVIASALTLTGMYLYWLLVG